MRLPARLAVMIMLFILIPAADAMAAKVRVDYDREADFESYKTFGWKDSVANSLAKNSLVHSRIKNGIEDQLSRGGLAQSDDSPDVLVTYHTDVQEEVRIDPVPLGYTYGPGWYYDPYWTGYYGPTVVGTTQVVTYRTGTLVVDIVDAKSQKVVFRGVAEDTLSEKMEKNEKKVYSVLEKMAKQFHSMRKKQLKQEAKSK